MNFLISAFVAWLVFLVRVDAAKFSTSKQRKCMSNRSDMPTHHAAVQNFQTQTPHQAFAQLSGVSKIFLLNSTGDLDTSDWSGAAVLVCGPLAIVLCSVAILRVMPGADGGSVFYPPENSALSTGVQEDVTDREDNKLVLGALVGITVSKILVASFARQAVNRNGNAQKTSLVPLILFINASSWMLLAIPYAIIRYFKRDASLRHSNSSRWDQAVVFVIFAATTNFCYIAALRNLPVCLTSAIFAPSLVCTLCFSAYFLEGTETGARQQQALCVTLALIGIAFVAKPGTISDLTSKDVKGIVFSLCAGLGNALYCIVFPLVFGRRLEFHDIFLFVARMGTLSFIIGGVAMGVCLHYEIYPLDLSLVPWWAVVYTAASSLIFNFLKNFGLSRRSPVTVDLAFQVATPLHFGIDVVYGGESFTILQGVGVIAAIISFVLCCTYSWLS